jgi:methyl-accepting chemotaxis protein
MTIRHLKISHKLILSFASILVFLLILAGITYFRVTVLNAEISSMSNQQYPAIVSVHQIKDELNISALKMYNLLVISDADDLKKEIANLEKSTRLIDSSVNNLIKNNIPGIAENEKEIVDVQKKIAKYQAEFISLSKQGRIEEAKTVLQFVIHPIHITYIEILDKLISSQSQQMESAGSESNKDAKFTRILIISITLVACILSALLALLTIKSITRPLLQAVEIAQKVADADLRSNIHVDINDETGQMLQALKDMNERLSDIVTKVRSGTETISTASAEIAQGNLDLSSRTEHQASSLEETASTMEELTSAVKHNAANAAHANQLAQTASQVAIDGGKVVSEVVNTMNSIYQSSKKVVDIISVIDGIAFQTNILALNAAVEAARAGEQGRGFAVVASEVRNLAQRSASAAKEIKELIGDSVKTIETGAKLVDQAGGRMQDIVKSVQQVTEIMGEISNASNEQTTGIEQINDAITQMDEVTQQNAALVEQAAAAAKAMQEESEVLANLVSVFQVRHHA